MKKDKSAAHRVQELISHATPKAPHEKKQRDYKHEETAPIPRGIENISPSKSSVSNRKMGGVKIIPQKPSKNALEQLHCSQNQNYPLFFIEKAEALQLKNIQSLRVKERIIAGRNIKNVSIEIQKSIYAQVTQDVKIYQDETLEFRNLIENREERHFRMDRIIKYLSDP